MKVMAQMGMVMNLDKCIGCHTCSVTCKQAWTNRAGVEYVWFNNVETRPGQGYPRTYQDQEKWKGGWVRTKRGKLKLRSVAAGTGCPRSSPTRSCPSSRTTTSPGPTSTTT
jgi:nitrate reductase beta subunit